MSCLSIRNFSCIDEASLTLSHLTVLIGPQASGKSVISKLMYFFYDSLLDMVGFDLRFEEETFEEFERQFLESFKKSFPSSAWGLKAFEIYFEAGPVTIKLNRPRPKKGSVGIIKAEFSDMFRETFHFIQTEQKIAKERSAGLKADPSISLEWDLFWRIRQAARNKLRKSLGPDFVNRQLFVPAGRSFFTSMGKAVVAFEQGGFLDPLTISFGKYFLAMRDRLSVRDMMYRSPESQKQRADLQSLRAKLSLELFSGTIKIEKNEEYVESFDGRKTPFSIMSSGQQELLPLWLTINEFMDIDPPDSLIYIEEPEAHLFPSAQGILTEYLAILLGTSMTQKMLITTHSPYILSKINNLLKAGALAGKNSKKEHSAIERIVPKQAWLKPGSISAYAIIERRLVSIMGEDGLIDGEYLDEVSGEIARDFSRMLEIEYVR